MFLSDSCFLDILIKAFKIRRKVSFSTGVKSAAILNGLSPSGQQPLQEQLGAWG